MYSSLAVATRIKNIAKNKNIVVRKMLLDCGLNQNIIGTMVYRGSMPKADNLAIIADYLGVSVDYLLGRAKIDEANIYCSILSDLSPQEYEEVKDFISYIKTKRDN